MSRRIVLVDRNPHHRMNGVARYMTNLAAHVLATPTPLDVRMLCHGREMELPHWLAQHRPPQPPRSWLTRLDRWLLQPMALRRSRADLLHFPYHNLPDGWHIGGQPRVLTVHGAAAIMEVEWGVPDGRADRIRQQLQRNREQLVHVITVSEWAKGEIVRHFALDPAHITPIYLGVDHRLFRPMRQQDELAWRLKRQFGLDGPYLLHVGPCSPRKNVETIVEAFVLLKQQYRLPHRLVLVGREDAARRRVAALCRRLRVAGDVVMPGVVGDEQLAELYNGTDCFLFPSLYEGFGLPLLEAMACGAPVITSNLTAMPEIAGGAALLLDEPRDADALAEGMLSLLHNSTRRSQLVAAGLRRAGQFTWTRSAGVHLRLYAQLLEEA